MAELSIAYRLPLDDWPQAVFESDYAFEGGRLTLAGATIAEAADRQTLERGVIGRYRGHDVAVRLVMDGHIPLVHVEVDGREAPPETDLRPRPSRSAWAHAAIALSASAAGFVASYLYLEKAWALDSVWSLKMANHMAAWHLLLTFTLFPASVWGRRPGIRAVQATSALFFAIHLGIAIANLVSPDPVHAGGTWIAVWNAVSGAFFLLAVFYGNIAWRDMDPARALPRAR
jgi:hypothetical protein